MRVHYCCRLLDEPGELQRKQGSETTALNCWSDLAQVVQFIARKALTQSHSDTFVGSISHLFKNPCLRL